MNGKAKKQLILTHIQKLIGRRMLESKRTKPCFYIEARADVTDLMAVRPKLRKQFGLKITTNAFYIHILALAVDKYPLMVGSLEADTIKIAGSVNVGFAVNAPQGLLVPVLKNADKKTLAEIAGEEQVLTEKARSNDLTLDDVQGETIALSNLGAYNLDSFIGIVPPPACAILAVGNVIPTVVARDGKVVSRKILTLNLAVDGRIVSHTYAAEFLHLIKEMLQNPNRQV
jgi:pyruvate dehydrogenase E2 component (dihydrolipoamide acetyltransferase)